MLCHNCPRLDLATMLAQDPAWRPREDCCSNPHDQIAKAKREEAERYSRLEQRGQEQLEKIAEGTRVYRGPPRNRHERRAKASKARR